MHLQEQLPKELMKYMSMDYLNDKKLKIKKVSRDCATKSKETRIRLWDKRTFWA